MRLFFRNLLRITTLALVGGGFTACSDDEKVAPPQPAMAVEGEATSWGSAAFTVTTNDIVEYAWMVLESTEEAPEETVVFMDGTTVAAPEAETKIEVSGLVGLTDYTLYVAAKAVPASQQVEEEFYGEVIAVPFTTLDYTDDVTIIKTTSEGAQIAIKYPEIAAE